MANKIDSVNSVNFNIGSGALAEGTKPALTAVRSVQSITKKNSLSSMVKDLIMQYPLFIDADIDVETAAVIAKAVEREYASLQLALWSADTAFGIDPTEDGGVRSFIRKYHNNSDTPDLVSYTGGLVKNISNFTRESAEIDPESITASIVRGDIDKEALESLWETVEDRITMESVNDLYMPGKNVAKKITSIAKAIEASNKSVKSKGNSNSTSSSSSSSSKSSSDWFDDFQSNVNHMQKNTPFIGKAPDKRKEYGVGQNNAKIINDKKLTSLEPTLLEVEFFVKHPNGGEIKKAIIGVKTMPRMIPPGAMAANIISALQGSHKAFQFVKWTRGETKVVRDMIFNVSQIKKDALTKDRFNKYFGAMRKRKNNFNTFKFGGETVNPFTTITVSMNTVERIKESAGYDLTDPAVAKKLINSLFLLGFQIVDTNTGVVSTILDDWNYFTDTTISALTESNKRDADNSALKEFLRIAGRSY